MWVKDKLAASESFCELVWNAEIVQDGALVLLLLDGHQKSTEAGKTGVSFENESGRFPLGAGRGTKGVETAPYLTPQARLGAQKCLVDTKFDGESAAVQGLLRGSGDGFNRWLVSYVQHALGAASVYIGEVRGADRDRVRTVAVCQEGQIAENFTYELRGTPCNEVISQGLCAHPHDVATLYPDAERLVEMGIHAYVGISLPSNSEKALGLLVVLSAQPFSEETLAAAVATLDLFSERASSELRYRRVLWEMEMAVAGTAGATLALLVEGMAKALHVQTAIASGVDPEAHSKGADESALRSLSIWSEVKDLDLSGDPIGGTAAEFVLQHGELLILSGVRRQFPGDTLLRATGAEACCAVAVYDQMGRPIGIIGIVHDRPIPESLLDDPIFQLFRSRIAAELLRQEAEAEHHHLQRRLAHAQRQESLGIMASGIAHDFNNLLMSILATADFLTQNASGETLEDLETIISASKQASSLCGQLLVYSGKGRHASSRVELSRLLAESLALVSVLVPPTGKLTTDFGEDLLWTDADPVQIQQVLINLAKNASEALVDHGRVEMSLRSVDCDESTFSGALVGRHIAPGRYCRISVSDDGVGMDAKTVAKVCEPFFSTKSHGHGLGLAAVLGIVERHRGALCVESELGKGSNFSLYLPRSDAGELESLPPSQARSEIEGIHTVLIIDDQKAVREAVSRMLQTLGILTFLADGGREGVLMFKDRWQSIDCVIVDLSMPELGGAEVVAMIRAIDATARIVVASGFPEEEVLRSMPIKPDGILVKPFALRRLEEVLSGLTADARRGVHSGLIGS